jgi:hypothetical protein
MKTAVCVCVCVLLGIALPHVARAGDKKKGGGGGGGGNKAAAHAGGGGAKAAAHTGGGGNRGASVHSGGMGRGLNAKQGGGQNFHAHGLNARGRGNLQGNHLGKNWNGRSFNRRFAARNRVGHWRSGLRWRNSHSVFYGYHRAWHDRWWWRGHYNRVVLVNSGYYYWDGGYWFPAWGYDPAFGAYAWDGPIYSYANLPPDQVIVNVQEELQDQGYYTGEVDGQLGSKTRDAIGAYQRDHSLEVTAAVDEPTVQALGLSS